MLFLLLLAIAISKHHEVRPSVGPVFTP